MPAGIVYEKQDTKSKHILSDSSWLDLFILMAQAHTLLYTTTLSHAALLTVRVNISVFSIITKIIPRQQDLKDEKCKQLVDRFQSKSCG